MDKPLLPLIDADILCFSVAAGAEEVTNWGKGVTTRSLKEPAEATLTRLEERIRAIRERAARVPGRPRSDRMIFALSVPSEETFRFKLWDGYKARRGPKPQRLALMKTHLRQWYEVVEKPALEADDILGILATHPKYTARYDPLIVSIDKDLMQIPAWHARGFTEDASVIQVSPEDGLLWHMIQTLAGDQCDGIKGCPGVGIKRSRSWIGPEMTPRALWAAVEACYVAHDLTPADALLNARLTRILHYVDWDAQKQEVKLWNPPQ